MKLKQKTTTSENVLCKYMYLNWAETEEIVTVYSIYYYVGPTEGPRTKPRGTPVLLS